MCSVTKRANSLAKLEADPFVLMRTCIGLLCVLMMSTSILAMDKDEGESHKNGMQNGEMKQGGKEHDGMKNEGMAEDEDHAHAHVLQDVSDWENLPSVSMQITKDAVSGWNLKITPTHFTFAPEHVNLERVDGEGHAHLFVDETKVARMYGKWFHLPALSPGRHSVKVQLNGNDHSTLAIGANPVEIITIVAQE